MKKLMRSFIFMFAMTLAGTVATPAFAQDRDQNRDRDAAQNRDQNRDQDRDRDRDQNRDQDRGRDRDRNVDESAFYSNRFYKTGWQDGGHHKRHNRKWKSDDDRRAYEAGFLHGDRGEKWQEHERNERH